MNKQWIIIVGIAILLMGGGAWWLWGRDVEEPSQGPVVNGIELDTTIPDSIPPLRVEQESVPEPDEPVVYEDEEAEQLKQVARLFVESWGSQSSLNDFQSLDMALVYATEGMKSDIRARKASLSVADDVPHIVSTVLGLNIENKEPSRMDIVASARRVERLNGEEKMYNQKANVTLSLVGSDWLVSGATWADTTF